MSIFGENLTFEDVHERSKWARTLLMCNKIVCIIIGVLIIVAIALHSTNSHAAHYIDLTLSVLFFISLALVITDETIEESRLSLLMSRHRGTV